MSTEYYVIFKYEEMLQEVAKTWHGGTHSSAR